MIKQVTHSFAGRLIAMAIAVVAARLSRWRCRVSNGRERAVGDGGRTRTSCRPDTPQPVEARSIPYAKSGKRRYPTRTSEERCDRAPARQPAIASCG